MSRRPSSTLVRKWCFEFWCEAYGITRILRCYMCGRVWEEKDWSKCEAEHEIARALGLARFGKEIDKPPNVKPCCAGSCQTLSPSIATPADCSSRSALTKTKPQALVELKRSSPYSGHKEKTKADVKKIAKVNRVNARASSFKRTKNKVPGSKGTAFARVYDKTVKRWVTVRREDR